MSAPAFDEAAEENRKIWPDRKCEVESAECDGRITPSLAGNCLCVRHYWEFSNADHGGTLGRFQAWMRTKGWTP